MGKRVYRGRRFWSRTVKEWKASGQTQREFAESRGVPPSTLCKWVGRLGTEANAGTGPAVPVVSGPTFVEVSPEPPAAAVVVDSSSAELRLVLGDVTAEFSRLPPPKYLAAVAGQDGGQRG